MRFGYASIMQSLKGLPLVLGQALRAYRAVTVLILCAVFFGSCQDDARHINAAVPPPEAVSQITPPPPPKLRDLKLDPPLQFKDGGNFNSLLYTYTAGLPEHGSTVRIVAEPENADCTVQYLPGQNFLPAHGSLAVIKVINKAGAASRYYISFQKDDTQNGAVESGGTETGGLPEASLSALALSAGSIDNFSPDVRSYDVVLPYGTRSAGVFPTGTAENSYFVFTPDAVLPLDHNSSGSVRIGVLAEGCRLGEYTLNFEASAPQPSMLADISLSVGAFTKNGHPVPFNPDPDEDAEQTISVPEGTETLAVSAIGTNSADRFFFNHEAAHQTGKIFSGRLDNTTFTVTANNGLGTSDRNYQFRIRSDINAKNDIKRTAFLDNLDWGGPDIDTTLYGREPVNGTNSAKGFAASRTQYNMNFEHGASQATLTANSPPGTIIKVREENGVSAIVTQNSALITVRPPSAARRPLSITVSGENLLPSTYTVFFKKIEPPPAFLSALSVSGALSIDPPSAPFDPKDTSERTVLVSDTAWQVFITAVPQNKDFTVRFQPNPFVTAPIAGKRVEITVSGGLDYTDTTYPLVFAVKKP